MPYSQPKWLLLLLLIISISFGSGFASIAKADSRPVHGGRAAQAAQNAPANLVVEAKEAGFYFVVIPPAPAAGEVVAGDDFDDDYDDADFATHINGDIADPLEPWNRFWHGFNDILWLQYVQPIWITYELVTPKELRQGVSNFFTNLAFPVRFINCLLQGKPMEAGVEFQRFIVNTTLGVGGLMTPAKHNKPLWSDEPDVTGFGQTLGRWGLGDGFYIVWPVLGPSTVRETFGLAGDFAVHPMTYASYHWDGAEMYTVSGLRGLHSVGERLEPYNSLRKISVEPYSALRNAFVQSSRSNVAGLPAPEY